MKLYKILASLTAIFFAGVLSAGTDTIKLEKAPVDVTDYASLQRGARTFMNQCSGCHGIKYTRYGSLAEGIGIVDDEGNILENVVKNDLMFTGDNLSSPIVTALSIEDAKKWFGKAPPDLSLITKSRSPDWVYTFLKSFYRDERKPWGVNNLLFPDVGMPHIMLNLQGVQELVEEANGGFSLKLVKQGELSTEEYDQVVADLVNFLTYVGEPHQVARKNIGVFVMAFLLIFMAFAYLLKREYWKDIH